nr:ABC transporter substrate-binding protein [Chelatococcus reniformis]
MVLSGLLAAACAAPALAQKSYDPGASDTDIKLGQTVPHSGPGSPYGVLGRAQVAYFEMLNEKGGINGRKVTLLSMDDAYSPPKTVEATRRLVEQDEVLALFSSLGTATQSAVQKYLNAKKVPQLLLNTGAGRWNEPEKFPWTTPGLPMYTTEAHILGKHILASVPDAKIGILAQHDDLGKEYVKALKEALGDKADKMIVAEQSYELADPTVDSQIIALANSGANVFYNITTGKATSQSIRKVAELGWKPLHLIMSGSTASELITAAGADKAIGLTTVKYRKNVGHPQWADDPDLKAYEAFRAKYLPNVDPNNDLAFAGYSQAVLMGKILEACGDELTRANVLKQATTLKNVTAPALIKGLAYSTSPTDYAPLTTLYLATYDGKDWKLGDKPISD